MRRSITVVESECAAGHDCDVEARIAVVEAAAEHGEALVSLDGRRLLALLDGASPDAIERVRRNVGGQTLVWQANAMASAFPGALGPGKCQVVVERRFDSPASTEWVRAGQNRCAPCLSVHRARLIGSYLSVDQRRMLCLFEANDAESLRQASRSMGLPVARIWTARPRVIGVPAAYAE
jgi:hypothetical protein